MARLVPQAHRRQHALRPDRPRHPDRHQPRRARRRRSGSSTSRRSTSRSAKGFKTDYAEKQDARPVLAAAAAGADRAVGREGRGRVPGRPPRMRPVPQAPVRPLDAGRLLGLRQHVRAGHVREQPVQQPGREEGRRRRERRAPAKPPTGKNNNQILLVREVFVAAERRQAGGRTPTTDKRARRRRRSAGRRSPSKAGEDPREQARRVDDARRTTRSSPAASSTASGATTSASASSTRWTTSRWPTRRPTPGCSTPWPKDFVEQRVRHPQAGADDPAAAGRTSSATRPNETNKFDKNNYSHAYVRPLMAEAGGGRAERRAGRRRERSGQDEAPAGHEDGRGRRRAGCRTRNLAYAFRIFGRPPRTTACDCERAMEPALPQTLFRMTDPTLLAEAQRRRTAALQQLREDED